MVKLNWHLIKVYIIFTTLICTALTESSVPNEGNGRLNLITNIQIEEISSIDLEDKSFVLDFFINQSWFINNQWCDQYNLVKQSFFVKSPVWSENEPDPIYDPDTLSRLWLPRTHIPNSETPLNADWPITDGFARIAQATNGSGCRVSLIRRLSTAINCDLNFSEYPYNRAKCPVRLTGTFYPDKVVHFVWDQPEITYSPTILRKNRFDIEIKPSTEYGLAYDGKNRTWLVINVTFYRKIGGFVITYAAPSILVVVSAYLSFFASVASGVGRILFSTKALLDMLSLYRGALNSNDYFNGTDLWMIVALSFTFVSISSVALCLHYQNISRQQKSKGQFNLTAEEPLVQSEIIETSQTNDNEIRSRSAKLKPCRCPKCRKIFLLRNLYLFKCDTKPIPEAERITNVMKIVYPVTFIAFNMAFWILVHKGIL